MGFGGGGHAKKVLSRRAIPINKEKGWLGEIFSENFEMA